MQIQFSDKTSSERYHLLTQAVIPRPVAWILTEDENEAMNLAPYSFFAPICSAPPTLVVSVGQKAQGVDKDSYRNLRRTGVCVVNLASHSQIELLNSSSMTLDAGESEAEVLGIPLEIPTDWPLPMVKDAPIAFLCRYQQQVDLGNAPQHIVFLEIEAMFIADDIVQTIDGRLLLDALKIDPVMRLGGKQYGRLTDVQELERPQ
ncbi:MAG: flavin reductase family protein [Oleibacter sp.]|nr:flavin reductase family protein [Thalassolituus sp.]